MYKILRKKVPKNMNFLSKKSIFSFLQASQSGVIFQRKLVPGVRFDRTNFVFKIFPKVDLTNLWIHFFN